jgi:predicted RNA-binding protein YlxR (DUF448 family)
MPPSERTCVACRKKGIKGELIKLANTPQGVIIDYSEKLPGRGAYVCAEMPCIGKVLKEGALSRAFKESVKSPKTEDFVAELDKKINRKIASLLGMARKSGVVAAGFDSAIEAAMRDTGGLVIMAQDLSDNTRKKAMEAGTGFTGRLVEYSTKDMLGSMLGMDPVGIVFIKNKELSDSLNKEIRRLINIRRG